jgi:hypothetical protein
MIAMESDCPFSGSDVTSYYMHFQFSSLKQWDAYEVSSPEVISYLKGMENDIKYLKTLIIPSLFHFVNIYCTHRVI